MRCKHCNFIFFYFVWKNVEKIENLFFFLFRFSLDSGPIGPRFFFVLILILIKSKNTRDAKKKKGKPTWNFVFVTSRKKNNDCLLIATLVPSMLGLSCRVLWRLFLHQELSRSREWNLHLYLVLNAVRKKLWFSFYSNGWQWRRRPRGIKAFFFSSFHEMVKKQIGEKNGIDKQNDK